MRVALAVLLALAAAAVPPPAGADHPCAGEHRRGCWCPEPELHLEVAGVYVVRDPLHTNAAIPVVSLAESFWVYLEWNGVPGLQRHDGYCYTPGHNSDALADLVVY